MSRGGLKISRNGHEHESGERVDWLDAFARKIEEASKAPTNAVESARLRNQNSLVDQISSIMSRNGPPSVESKVQDYQDKIGLKEYLRRMSATNEDLQKKLAAEESKLPESFLKLPENVQQDIKNFIRNKCETHHGNIQVPALVEEVSKTFRNAGVKPQDVNDMHFEKFISDEIMAAKKRNPSSDEHNSNIGLGVGVDRHEIDSSNSDIFEGLAPTKTSG